MPPDPDEPFEAFAARLGRLFDEDPTGWTGAGLLTECLPWDSLALVEVAEWLAQDGVTLPEGLITELATLGDLHHYATTPGTRRDGSAPAPGPVAHRSLLEPVRVTDHDALFDLLTAHGHLTRFRFRGVTPSPEAFHRQLWDRVLAQFVVRTRPGGAPAGLVTAYEADLRNRHVHLAAVSSPALVGSGVVAEAVVAFVDYLFDTFDLRKVYAETLSGNFSHFASGARQHFTVEGRLRDHEYVDGGYEDLLIVSATRTAWQHRSSAPAGGSASEPAVDVG